MRKYFEIRYIGAAEVDLWKTFPIRKDYIYATEEEVKELIKEKECETPPVFHSSVNYLVDFFTGNLIIEYREIDIEELRRS